MGFVQGVITDLREVQTHRKRAEEEKRLSTLAVNEGRGFRLPICYGNDTFLLSDEAAWTGFYLNPKSSGFLDRRATREYFEQATNFFARVFPADSGNEGHLLVTNRVHSPDDWARALIERHKDHATDSWAPLIQSTRRAIDAREFFERDTYMFVRLGARGNHEGLRGLLRQGMETFLLGAGAEDTQPDDPEIEDWADQADTVADTLVNSWVSAMPINRRRVEWMVRNIDSPGLPTPETIDGADGEPWGIGWWRTVLSSYTRPVDLGRVARNRYKAIEFDSPTGSGKTYAAFLPLSYIPQKVAFDQNWLHHASLLPFPVDVSLRFEIIDPDRASREFQRPINRAEAQKEADHEAGITPDEATQLQQDQLKKAQTKVKMGREAMARWQAVFCVYDTDPVELRSKITRLIKHYRDIHFELVNPPYDQRELFYQSFPGGEIEVDDWIHRSDPKYLGSAMPWLTSQVGDRDGSGLYQGYTVVRDASHGTKEGTPVFYDLLNVVDQEGTAPTEAVAGESGYGKTVSRGLKSAYEDYHRGVTQLIWDPKGDFLSLVVHAKWLRIDLDRIKLVDLQDPKTSVSLDPFGTAEVEYDPDTGEALDDRRTAAVDLLLQLLRRQLADQPTLGDRLIRQAVNVELEKEKALTYPEVIERRSNPGSYPIEEEPCLEGVIDTFQSVANQNSEMAKLFPEDQRSKAAVVAGGLAEALNTYRSSTLGKHLFRRPSEAGTLRVERGDLLLFCAINMKTTEPGDEQTEKTVVPDAISSMMVDYIRSILYILPDEIIKSASFDEWHVIKRSNRADALVKWLRRMGRSKRCMVRQLSQSANDFYNAKDVTSSRTSLATVWCGRVNSEDEAKASCILLGIEASRANMMTLMNLDKGQFLFKDSLGRVQFVKVDFTDPELLERFDTDAAKKEYNKELAKKVLADRHTS